MFGAEKSNYPSRNKVALQFFLANIDILPLTQDVADHYAIIRATLEKTGTPIGPNDTWIAAHALNENCILVTNNTREFSRIKDLVIEDWTK